MFLYEAEAAFVKFTAKGKESQGKTEQLFFMVSGTSAAPTPAATKAGTVVMDWVSSVTRGSIENFRQSDSK